MNPPSGSGEFTGSNPAYEAALTHPLDTVRACADIAGDMPGHWTFLLYNHGMGLAQKEDTMSNTGRLAEHLLTADAVGIEIALSDGYSPQAIEQLFENANGYLADGKIKGDIDLTLLEDNNAIYTIFGIARGLRKLGRNTMPIFFPVDAYADSAIQNRFWYASHREAYSGEEITEKAAEFALAMRDRETLVLHQAQRQAIKLLPDKPRPEIAIVAGAAHTLLPIAAEALGAETTTVRLDKLQPNMLFQLQQELRFATTDTVARKQAYALALRQAIMAYVLDGHDIHAGAEQVQAILHRLWAQRLDEMSQDSATS